MSKKHNKLKVESRFVHSGHGLGLSVTPAALTNESKPAHGAHYILPGGADLTSPNGSHPVTTPLELGVNGNTFAISFRTAHGNVESIGPDEDGHLRQFFATARVENLKVADVTDGDNPQIRVEAKLVAAGALSKSFPSKRHGGSHARPGRDGEKDTHNLIEGLKLDGKTVDCIKVDRTPLSLFPTLDGLADNFKGEFKKKFKHRFLLNGKSLSHHKVFATMVDLGCRGSKRRLPHKVCGNPRAAGRGHVIYLDRLGRLELGLAWRTPHALRIQMLRILLDPTVRVENYTVLNEGLYPLKQPFSHAAAAAGQGVQELQLRQGFGLQDEADAAGGSSPPITQAQVYCADVESCGEHYPPGSGSE